MTRPFSMIRTRDQWIRASHTRTALDPDSDAIQLASEAVAGGVPGVAPVRAGGLAFDAACRLYTSRPDAGQVERVRWGSTGDDGAGAPVPVRIFDDPPASMAGDFTQVPGAEPTALTEPRGLAVDAHERLFVADTGGARIVVVDVWGARLLRTVRVPAPDGGTAAPLDLAACGDRVWAVLAGPPWLVVLEARRGPWPVDLPRPDDLPAAAVPVRVASYGAEPPLLLYADGTGRAWVGSSARAQVLLATSDVTDIELLTPSRLVLAHRPGEPFSQYELEPDSVDAARPLRARGYDGLGIARAPDGRLVYGAASGGWRHAIPARLRYARTGRVVTYRLDSGVLHNEWGRVFLDACVPEGARIKLHCTTTDELDPDAELPPLPWVPPPNVVLATLVRPELTPPLPPAADVPAENAAEQELHRRESGRDLPWSRPAAGDPFETYEAPVLAPPGRYLWLTLDLSGTSRVTPSVRAVRVEHSSHDLLRRLPRTFSREPQAASFLRRYLAILEGTSFELDARGDSRERLLDPRVTPPELLPWLASFLGLVLDERWPVCARRTLVREAAELFRLRGTVASIERLLEIYLGRRPLIVEHFKLRGLGGVLVGGSPDAAASGAIVGAGLRVGGAAGTDTEPGADAFVTHAHRFTVVVPGLLASEQLLAVRDALDLHRPAHTLFDVCTVGSGMRVGRGLHVGLLSTIGRTGGFDTLQLGESSLGRGAVVGRPDHGARVGQDGVGEVRVG